MITAALAGLGLGFSLIVAIGAQNAFVLRQGLLRQHVLVVVAICALSDIALIALGIAGAGAVFTALPWLVEVVRWAGAAFLFVYGLLAARRAWKPKALEAADATKGSSSLLVIASTCLALTWLNPHVYLDTLVLLGSVGNTYGDDRWAFGIGAAIASVVWFTVLGFGARLLEPVFAKPIAWRVLDVLIAIVMITLAITLLLVR